MLTLASLFFFVSGFQGTALLGSWRTKETNLVTRQTVVKCKEVSLQCLSAHKTEKVTAFEICSGICTRPHVAGKSLLFPGLVCNLRQPNTWCVNSVSAMSHKLYHTVSNPLSPIVAKLPHPRLQEVSGLLHPSGSRSKLSPLRTVILKARFWRVKVTLKARF
jgi:hypothetical protein